MYILMRVLKSMVVCWFIVLFVSAQAAAATKVAFIADQGVGSTAKAVLSLIHDEGADIVLIQGDLGYHPDTAAKWEQNLTDYLGADFPVVTVAGNHENHEWPLYEQFIQERVARAEGLTCTGRVGVKASCTFGNLQVVQVAQGLFEIEGVKNEDDYDGYIRAAFSEQQTPWKVCSWHKNQHAMQAYSKDDATGWDIYDACLDAGAMIAMGHAHTYSRTYLLDDFRTQSVAHRGSDMVLEPGRSFAVVSGLGGHDIRPQENFGDWFGSVYTSTQGATHGALFCTLEETTADCYFKAIDGAVPDRFTLRTRSGIDGTPVVNQAVDDPLDASVTEFDLDILEYKMPDDTLQESGVFKRTDKNEYRWLARNDEGQWASRFISQACAMDLGGAVFSGDWHDLTDRTSNNEMLDDPCISSNEAPREGIVAAPSENGFVFSRSDKFEYRWIDTNSRGRMGSVWIDENCANQLGGVLVEGDWSDLMRVAPDLDTLGSPCSSKGQVLTQNPDISGGYVFARTDKEEYRWINTDEFGRVGNTWIDKSCAEQLGGVSTTGDWFDLNELAPGFDTLISPCY